MVSLMRVTARWNGFPGAPGYSVFHLRDFDSGTGGNDIPTAAQAGAAALRIRGFFDAIKGILPSVATIQVSGEVEVVDSETGNLIDAVSAGVPGVVTGGITGVYASPVGAVVNWRTGSVRNGRRLRGRTFIVPMAGSQFASGILLPAAQTTIQTAASALADSTQTPDLFVFGRPTSSGASDGVAAVVTGAQVPSLAAILRSRRD